MSSSDQNRQTWQSVAKRVSQRINLAWWLETTTIPLVILGLAGACAMLLVRREVPATHPAVLPAAAGAAVLVVIAAAWLIARRRFEKPDASMVRIEATMHLRNRLSAALAGVAPWPDTPDSIDDGLRWRWSRLVIPPIASLACLAAGLLIPVSALTEGPPQDPDQPLAWREIEADLDLLDREQVADESQLEEVRRKLDELRKQPPEDWFAHSSLEATDNLRREHRAELERVERGLTRSERALGALQEHAKGMAEADRQRLADQFDSELQGLQQGALKPNKALMDQLGKLDPKMLDQLDQDQLEQLREALRKNAKGFGDCNGCQGGGDDDWLDELLGEEQPGDEDGQGPGRGGVNRGPGTNTDVFGKERGDVEIGELTPLEAEDLSRSAPGDLLQLQDGEHRIDETSRGPSAGGSVDGAGAGGERVWREALDPEEQRAIKRFFE